MVRNDCSALTTLPRGEGCDEFGNSQEILAYEMESCWSRVGTVDS